MTVLREVNLFNHPKQQQQNQQLSQCQADHSSVEVRIDFYLTIQSCSHRNSELLLMMEDKKPDFMLNHACPVLSQQFQWK